MSWQQPQGNYNPNANAYVPGQPYYPGGQPPQQQQSQGGYNNNMGYGGNQGGYQGGYPGGSNSNNMGYGGFQGGYNNNNNMGYSGNQGGYNNNTNNMNYGGQQGGYPGGNQGGYPGGNQGYGNNYGSNNRNAGNYQSGGYQPQQQQQQQQQQPQQRAVPAPAPAPAVSAADANKLALGGGTSNAAPLPKKKGGGTLSLGKKKQEDVKAEKPKDEDAPTGSPASPKAPSPAPSKEKDGSTAITATGDAKTKMTPEELRESVKKEIAKQRAASKKQFVRDPRPHFNVVFCGHVDAGKSTISGHLLMEKGQVDQREMDKLRREAEQHHREGWEYAYVMDVSEEERSKGITRETGAAYIETDKRRLTILDAPGHKAFVPSMIGGATQADICVLVISSRTGEFETGFERGGQTREHTTLVRTCGVKQLICVINKMDEMGWSKERYDEIVGKLKPFLKQNGYDEEKNKNLAFIPVAGLTGQNLIQHTTDADCPWYSGPTMIDLIDTMVIPEQKSEDDVLCIPLAGAYKDDGKNYVYGKVESGSIAVGEKVQILPTKQEGFVEAISIESTEFEKCYPGDNVHLRVRGITEDDVHVGYVATSVPTSMRAVEFIQARVVILEVKNIISAGYSFMLHIHAAQEEAPFHKLLAKLDRKTGEVIEKNPACAKAGDVVMVRIELTRPVVCECHKDFDKMGRFVLREDGKTFAIGLITKLYDSTHESLAKGGSV